MKKSNSMLIKKGLLIRSRTLFILFSVFVLFVTFFIIQKTANKESIGDVRNFAAEKCAKNQFFCGGCANKCFSYLTEKRNCNQIINACNQQKLPPQAIANRSGFAQMDNHQLPAPRVVAKPVVTTKPNKSVTPSQKPITATVAPLPTTASPVKTPMPTSAPTIIKKRILLIGFNPVENGVSYADKYFKNALGGKPAEVVENEAYDFVKNKFNELSNNQIQFEIVKKINISQSIAYPDGYNFTLDSYKKCVYGTPDFDPILCENRKWMFDYNLWLSSNNICQKMKDNNADEIWMFSLPYIMAYENFMIGPTSGFNINGPGYIDANCSRHYAVINGTYDRPDLPFHNYGHRIEATMNYLTEKWSWNDRQKYWNDFAATSQYALIPPSNPVCGNTHFPFNTKVGYDVSNTTSKINTCSDWNNFPNLKGTTTTESCTIWGCNDPGWQSFWFGALPRSSGEATLTSYTGKSFQFSRNWWNYILDPDAALNKYFSIQ